MRVTTYSSCGETQTRKQRLVILACLPLLHPIFILSVNACFHQVNLRIGKEEVSLPPSHGIPMNFRVTGKTVEMFPEMLVAFGTDLENQFFLKDGLSCLTLFKSSKIMIVFKRMHHKNILNISCKNRFVLRLVKYKESHSITCLIVSVNCLFTAEYMRVSIKYSKLFQ